MNLQNTIKLALKKAHATTIQLATFIESLDLKNRSIQLYQKIQTLLSQSYAWTLKILKYLKNLAVKAYRKTQQAILLSIDYTARKIFIFEQWSNKYIKPRWHKLTQRTRELLLHAAEAAVYITKTISSYLWQLACDFIKYIFLQLRNLAITTFKTSRSFLIKSGIFLVYCRKKSWHYTKLFYIDLINDCRVSWRVFIRLLNLLYKYSKATIILSGKALRRTAIFLVFCLNESWKFFKYFVGLSFKYSLSTLRLTGKGLKHTGIFLVLCLKKFRVFFKYFFAKSHKFILIVLRLTGVGLKHTGGFLSLCLIKSWVFFNYLIALLIKSTFFVLKLIDSGFKRSGILLTRGLHRFWQVLILFGQGLSIIANHLWRLLTRIVVSTLTGIDSGFKKSGFFLTFSLVKIWHLFSASIHLLATAINWVTETILTFTVQSIRISGIFLWRTLKFLLWSPVTLLKFILPEVITHQLKQYALLIRLDKPIGILLLLWPTLIALWLAAGGWPDINVLLVFVAGVFLMRSAGCAINDFADREIDSKVKRTKDRPLASGEMTAAEALVIFASLCILAYMLVLLMNGLTITLSFIGLALAASYPFMKRYHYLPQVHLGAAFGWAVPMAFAAQANELAPIAWLLFFATVLWATAYDTMYAMVDRDDDILIGAKSTAILFEDADTLIIGIIQSILIICLIMIGIKAELGGFYFLSVLIATGFAAWQQFLIKDRQPAQCFKAFMNNNWFGLILFAGVFLEYQVGGIST